MLSDSETSQLVRQLSQFGCNDREARIYLESLQAGPATIQQLATRLKYNRVTVHSAVSQLLEKGILFESRKGKKRLIVAEQPAVFGRLVQRRENELKVMKESIRDLSEFLTQVKVSDSSVPAVKIYEEVDGFKRMLEETLEAKGEVLVFTYVDLFSKLVNPDYLEDYFRRRADRGIHTRLIFPPCPFARRVNQKRERYRIQVRLLPSNYVWSSGIFSWNNSIAVKSFTKKKITCTIIENADIAHFWRNVVFDLTWKQAIPME